MERKKMFCCIQKTNMQHSDQHEREVLQHQNMENTAASETTGNGVKRTDMKILAAFVVLFGITATMGLVHGYSKSKKRKIKRRLEAIQALIDLIVNTSPGPKKIYELEKSAHKKLFKRVGWKNIDKLVDVARKTLKSDEFEVTYVPSKHTLEVRNHASHLEKTTLRERMEARFRKLIERARGLSPYKKKK